MIGISPIRLQWDDDDDDDVIAKIIVLVTDEKMHMEHR